MKPLKYSSKILSQTVTQLCLAKEITHIVISPGSRNAPLTIGFTENYNFKNFSIVDERCAAFFALGMAQQLNKPVALICTSGSALLNYYPAIAEAFYSDIPLVVISADRPLHLVDIGDGQTIRQENVFANHILYNANCIEGSEHQLHNEKEINIALNTAIEFKGPVHINVPFTEPLYLTVDSLDVSPQNVLARTISLPFEENIDDFVVKWNSSAKKVILVGVLPPNSIENDLLQILANDESTIVLTETTSNLYHEQFFPAIDQLIAPLNESDFKKLQPDLLLTFGGMVVSKKIKAFLRTYSPKEHWHVDEKKAYDTYFKLTHHFKTTPNRFLTSLLPQLKKVASEYQAIWLLVKKHRELQHEKYVAKIPFSDFKVFSEIFKNIPHNIQLQLSNSATIRYAQLFNIHSSIDVFCNRGTSGIDGSTSTAIGAALISNKPTVFITGDLSFLYDSNGLWNNYMPDNFKIIVVNNSGGGIFRILPGAKNTAYFNEYFETKHTYNTKYLCEMYDIEYQKADSDASLTEKLASFFTSKSKPSLLEIFTPSEINDIVLLDYFKEIK